MGTNWLADADPGTSWANHPWTGFASLPQKEYGVVVLPVHGLGGHDSREPLDAGELAGSRTLRAAATLVSPRCLLRVLPPLRFGPETSGSFFGLDSETAGDLVQEIAAGVKAAGFQKLVLFNTNPAAEPFVNAAAIDARTALGLRTYVIHASTLGPEPSRVRAQDAAPIAVHLANLLIEIRQHLAPRLPPCPANEPPPPDTEAADFPVYRSRYLPALTREQLGSRLAGGEVRVILPIGAIEQHGPHLPVGVDAILGQALLDAALSRLPPGFPAWVAPSLAYGKSNEHLGFPGTVTLTARTLRRIVLAVARQVRALGARHLLLLNTHGGNSAVLQALTRETHAGLDLDITVLRPATEPELSSQEAAWGFHAGEWETSLMLACAPSLVRIDRAVREFPARQGDSGELRPEHAPATFAWMTRDISRLGVMGDPTQATAEKGRRWLSHAADALAVAIGAQGASPSSNPVSPP